MKWGYDTGSGAEPVVHYFSLSILAFASLKTHERFVQIYTDDMNLQIYTLNSKA